MTETTFHVRYCTSMGGTVLSDAYPSPGEALEAACWLWAAHKYWGICVVSVRDGAVEIYNSEDAVKLTAERELQGARLN